MTTSEDRSQAIEARLISCRRRVDLAVREIRGRGRQAWRIKDPVALNYFELTDQEMAVLDWLDGQTSLRELHRRFNARFAPEVVSTAQLQAFVWECQSSGLVVDDRPGVGTAQAFDQDRRRMEDRWRQWTNVLSWRFRGFNPTAMLDRMVPWMQRIPPRTAAALLMVTPLVTILLMLLHPAELRSRTPSLSELMSPSAVGWFWLAIVCSRAVHEVAHAAVCRLFGGECPEMGIQLLFFTPCLYCDVSDAWLLPSRAARLLISAAGMIAEFEIAAVCFLIWWYSVPGPCSAWAFSMSIACSVNSVFLNGNPLLRYDGYYLLSDAIDEPNLSQKGSDSLGQLFTRLVLGTPMGSQRGGVVRNPGWVALYGMLAAVYRPLVWLVAGWGVLLFAARQGYRDAAWLAFLAFLAAWVRQPITSLGKLLFNPVHGRRLNRRRVVCWGLACSAMWLAAAWIPLPRRVSARVLVDAPRAAPLYVTVEGRLLQSVAEGTSVEAGEPVARLQNPALERDIEQLQSEARRLEYRLLQLEADRGGSEAASSQIPATRETLDATVRLLAERRADLSRLELKSPIAGIVLPPPRFSAKGGRLEQLAHWTGTPLEPANQGTWLNAGTLVAQVGDPRELSCVIRMDPADAGLVKIGQKVHLRISEVPWEVFTGKVSRVGVETLNVSRLEGAARGRSAEPTGGSHRDEREFLARVELTSGGERLRLRDIGEARIQVDAAPCLPRFWNWLRRSFRLPAG